MFADPAPAENTATPVQAEPVLGGMFADPASSAPTETTSSQVINIPEKTETSGEIELPTIDVEPSAEAPTEEPKEEAPALVETEATPAIELPVINEEPVAETPTVSEEVKEEPAQVEAETAPVVDVALPVLDGNNNKVTYINESNNDGKAIIVTGTQVTKLRASKDSQKALLDAKKKTAETPTVDKNAETSKQIEEMMAQLPLLYEEGKKAEAEAMSEQISALSKTLTKSA